MMKKIDFVITWVDGNDSVWRAEKSKYSPIKDNSSDSENRYRDWELLKFWFRGVEKYAPWVNKVYFVTCGHYPKWLNLEHPKLQMVSHEEFIPKEYLPTFNSNTILLNIHRIKDLQEQFVLFNDDMFIINHAKPEGFFVKGKPVDAALLSSISSIDIKDIFPHLLLNNIAIINQHFDKNTVLKKNWQKFFSLKYSGKELLRSLLCCGLFGFRELYSRHLPCAYLKSSYQKVWDAENELLNETCTHKFRSTLDVTEWLVKNWQLCEGLFYPQGYKWGEKFELGKDDEKICQSLMQQKFTTICINDSSDTIDFDKTKSMLISCFTKLFPEKSKYERGK